MTQITKQNIFKGSVEDIRIHLKEWLSVSDSISDQVLAAAIISDRYFHKLNTCRRYPEALNHLLRNPPKVPVNSLGNLQPEISNRQLVNKASRSIAKWACGGMKQVDEEVREKRLRACAECLYVKDASTGKAVQKILGAITKNKLICSICGCNVRVKGRFPHETCPVCHPVWEGYTRWGEPIKTGDK